MAASGKLSFLVRSLSTSASLGQMVKPPIQVFGLEGRYATALYSAATKLKQVDAVEKELIQVQEAMRKNPVLREVISSPIINRRLMANTIQSAGNEVKFSAATSNLLCLLAENGRLKKVGNIINAYKSIMAAHRGEVVCEVTTAKPLEPSQRKQLEDALKKFVQAKETIQLTAKVDPSLIGGMVVSIGDKYVDMSIATKIKKLTDVITTTA